MHTVGFHFITRPITRISQRVVQLDLVSDNCSREFGGCAPDADNNLIFDVF